MIYRSRKRWGESPQRRRKQGFYAVVKPRNEAENGLLCKRHWMKLKRNTARRR